MKKDLIIILVLDFFKESMIVKEVCEVMERGIKKVNDSINCIYVFMVDGGEGIM